MQRIMRLVLPGLAALVLGVAGSSAGAAPDGDKPDGDKKGLPEPACGEYGTTVEFEKTPSDAARKALKEEKLVMVLHVSGHFEEPDFT